MKTNISRVNAQSRLTTPTAHLTQQINLDDLHTDVTATGLKLVSAYTLSQALVDNGYTCGAFPFVDPELSFTLPEIPGLEAIGLYTGPDSIEGRIKLTYDESNEADPFNYEAYLTSNELTRLMLLHVDSPAERRNLGRVIGQMARESDLKALYLDVTRFDTVYAPLVKTYQHQGGQKSHFYFAGHLEKTSHAYINVDSLIRAIYREYDGQYELSDIRRNITNLFATFVGFESIYLVDCGTLKYGAMIDVDLAFGVIDSVQKVLGEFNSTALKQFLSDASLDYIAAKHGSIHAAVVTEAALKDGAAPQPVLVDLVQVEAECDAELYPAEAIPTPDYVAEYECYKEEDNGRITVAEAEFHDTDIFENAAIQRAMAPHIFRGHELRVDEDENGEPIFCLADVCEAMGFDRTDNVANQVKIEFGCPLLKRGHIKDNLGRNQVATFLTEPQLYFVIMRGRSQVAHDFRQWVCNEVLPSIRKHGSYCLQGAVKMENGLIDASALDPRKFRFGAVNPITGKRAFIDFPLPDRKKDTQFSYHRKFTDFCRQLDLLDLADGVYFLMEKSYNLGAMRVGPGRPFGVNAQGVVYYPAYPVPNYLEGHVPFKPDWPVATQPEQKSEAKQLANEAAPAALELKESTGGIKATSGGYVVSKEFLDALHANTKAVSELREKVGGIEYVVKELIAK